MNRRGFLQRLGAALAATSAARVVTGAAPAAPVATPVVGNDWGVDANAVIGRPPLADAYDAAGKTYPLLCSGWVNYDEALDRVRMGLPEVMQENNGARAALLNAIGSCSYCGTLLGGANRCMSCGAPKR